MAKSAKTEDDVKKVASNAGKAAGIIGKGLNKVKPKTGCTK